MGGGLGKARRGRAEPPSLFQGALFLWHPGPELLLGEEFAVAGAGVGGGGVVPQPGEITVQRGDVQVVAGLPRSYLLAGHPGGSVMAGDTSTACAERIAP